MVTWDVKAVGGPLDGKELPTVKFARPLKVTDGHDNVMGYYALVVDPCPHGNRLGKRADRFCDCRLTGRVRIEWLPGEEAVR